MSAFLYGVALQCKLDIRSKALLITCYAVPLLFFLVMGGIFTSIMPEAKNTLIQSMSVMGVAMGAFIGVPPSLTEIYGSDIKKVYKANGVPLYLGLVSVFLSAFIHLLIMCGIIYITAPLIFGAALPANPAIYFASVAIFIAVSLSVGCILGIAVKKQTKLTMLSQILFLPSIMLSGIMFPTNMLPKAFEYVGKIFPASWSFIIMTQGITVPNLWPLLVMFAAAAVIIFFLLKKLKSE